MYECMYVYLCLFCAVKRSARQTTERQIKRDKRQVVHKKFISSIVELRIALSAYKF